MGVNINEPTRPAAGTFSTDDDRRDARWVGAGLLVMVIALIVALIVISGAANPGVELTLFKGTITHDQVLLLGVLTAGALGGCIHVATSFSDYVGNNEYKASWQYWYMIRPFIGGCLASAFYFLLRGGLLSLASADGGNQQQSPSFYGVTAIAFLVGMFSKQATDKLDDVFDTLFKSNKDAARKNGLDTSKPVLTALNPPSAPPAAAEQVVELQGTGFVAGAQVRVNGTARPATGDVSATSIKVTLTATEMGRKGDFKLAVVNPDNGVSNELTFSVMEPQPADDGRGAGAGADLKIQVPGILNEAGVVTPPGNQVQQTVAVGASSTTDAQQSAAGSTDAPPATGQSDAQPQASGGGGDGQTTPTGGADSATQPNSGESSGDTGSAEGGENSTSRAG
jgi:hypothetical protein